MLRTGTRRRGLWDAEPRLQTRLQGIYARHQARCAREKGAGCNCTPSSFGVVYDCARKRQVKTRRQRTIEAARNARDDLARAVATGRVPDAGGIRLTEGRERFVQAAREGHALNKQGQRYKPGAIDDIAEVLRVHAEPTLGMKRLSRSGAMCRTSWTSLPRTCREAGSDRS
jgi:hypothetical protein